MKRHLIKFIGSAEMDYHTSTYCNMHSDEWSEEFGENVNKTLTKKRDEATCKKCINAYYKENIGRKFKRLEALLITPQKILNENQCCKEKQEKQKIG